MSGMSQAVNALALHVDIVAGVNTTTQTLTGIAVGDTIVAAYVWLPGASATLTDITTNITVSATDLIAMAADYSASSKTVMVIWQDGNAAAGARQPQSDPCLRFNLVTGSATTRALTGITTSDVIAACLHFTTAADITALDLYTDVTISAADEITFGTDCTNDHCLIIWQDMTSGASPQSYSSVALNITMATGGNGSSAVAGMVATDVVLFVGHLTTTTNITTIADITSTCTAAAVTVTHSADHSSDSLWVWWLDTSA